MAVGRGTLFAAGRKRHLRSERPQSFLLPLCWTYVLAAKQGRLEILKWLHALGRLGADAKDKSRKTAKRSYERLAGEAPPPPPISLYHQ